MSSDHSWRLHRAIWTNNLDEAGEIIKHLKSVDVVDDESGWTPLHKALYFGHLRSAAYLLRKGAKLTFQDHEGRTPLDLANKELSSWTRTEIQTEVFSWGSGVNYQLGTGKTSLNQPPRRLESFRNQSISTLAAGKFHNLALSKEGEVFSWGWGRGGRLGFPDSQLHSNNGAQILPRLIPNLSGKLVVSIGVAKHHSLAVLSTGEVYSWGLNRDGRLGYTTVNKQTTPKRIHALKGVHSIFAAAANKHSAIITSQGEVYTWGSNVYGQLGYGTSDSGSNPTPQRVDSLQPKSISQISLSKRHSLALSSEGEVYSWGNKLVAPKKVLLTGIREIETVSCGGEQIQFHRGFMKVKKPLMVGIAAGVDHSGCISTTGCVFCWNSDQPKDTVIEIAGILSGKKAISISAGKSSMAVVVAEGEVYAWESQKNNRVCPRRVDGLKNVKSVVAGEKHFLVLQEWRTGQESENSVKSESLMSLSTSQISSASSDHLLEPEDRKLLEPSFSHLSRLRSPKTVKKTSKLMSLQEVCEKAVAKFVLSPTTALQLFEYSDRMATQILKSACLNLIILNLSLVLHESVESFVHLPEHLLWELEEAYQREILKLTEGNEENWWMQGWTPGKDIDLISRRPTYNLKSEISEGPLSSFSSLSEQETPATPPIKANRFLPEKQDSIAKIRRTMVKKLEQIEALFRKEASGKILDQWQRSKVLKKGIFQTTLEAISRGESYESVQAILNKSPQSESRLPENQQQKNKKAETGALQQTLSDVQQEEKNENISEDQEKESWISVSSIKEKKTMKQKTEQILPSKPVSKECCAGRRKLSLGDFIPPQQKPNPALPRPKGQGPAWGGASIKNSCLSFQRIQEEQKNRRPGCPLPDDGMKPAVERKKTVSRWQVPCDVQIQSINHIQVEEKAVQELTQFYKGAKVKVKIGTAKEVNKR